MATISFDRDIIIKSDKACSILNSVFNKKNEAKIVSTSKKIDINKALNRGKAALKKYCSHSQQS